MRIIILFLLTILMASNAIAQQPTEKQLEQQKQLHERYLKDKKAAEKKESENKTKSFTGARWTGTVTCEATIIYANSLRNGKVEIHGQASFINALPTLYRDDGVADLNFTDDKGQGSHIVHSKITEAMLGNKNCVGDCEGTGKSELHAVAIREWDNTYDIEVIFPHCVGTINCAEDGVYESDDLEAIVSNHRLLDKNMLSGTESTTGELPGGFGTVTKTITWHLVREKEDDVELIVTPVDYDTWLPEPGKDEFTKGSVMKISLKIFGKNGQKPKLKTKSFELRLSNTSKEPGITINFPLTSGNYLPDLRFLPQAGAVTGGEFQFAVVKCNDGINGEISLAAYDGGGYTTLTSFAILEDNSRIEGHLLISGGKTEISIPKRSDNSHIGTAWLVDHGNPLDMDDHESSGGNNNDGDGLTAYEEYRGVMTQGEFHRLDPQEKELGVFGKQADMTLFSEGMDWFKNASGINVIRFRDNEIGPDRRLNKNHKTSHLLDQYALRIEKNTLPKFVLGRTNGGPGIPAAITNIIIDYKQLAQQQQDAEKFAIKENIQLPFTLKELLAKDVAHELAHGVNIHHHGQAELVYLDKTIDKLYSDFHMYDINGAEITTRPYHLIGLVGEAGKQASGDIFCVINYNPGYDWSGKTVGNAISLYLVPLLPVGNVLCNSRDGTGINTKSEYFGDATVGNCLSQIKLKN
jgi:hypothetical protein